MGLKPIFPAVIQPWLSTMTISRGHVADVTAMLAHKSINIATMQLYRAARGGMAVMVIECDQEIPEEGLVWLRRQEGIRKVTYLSLR